MDEAFSKDVLLDGIRPGHQFIFALVSGGTMTLLCMAAWPVIAYFAGPELDVLAVGVGVLVGLAIRLSGKGTTPVYGALAMILTLSGSMVGNTLGVIASGTYQNLDIFGAIQHIHLGDVVMSILDKATYATYFFFTVGVVLAYLVAVRRPD